ncbi:MAG: heme A synthase [Leptothrix sp. (in: Bacteria)]|nr:heme A synthase [Leptothrix sp. (in: b-proteobacteria)]
MPDQALVDFAPVLRLALLALVTALLPLSWVWVRQRGGHRTKRLAALTTLTLFLTFDLVVFGSFTRLSDSGLGCPDWPGCYGEASPFGAHDEIHAAQTAKPSGPVTWGKAWIEMIHRYLAMTVGVLILVMAAVSWRERRRLPFSPWWPTLTLAWVIVQGLFGKYTVTLKLYPAIVTLHLLGGLTLLGLLAVQHEAFRQRPLALPAALRRGVVVALVVLALQIALGGWVSTNYAVLACTGFPQCNGQWWPAMEASGFALRRELGMAGHGGVLSFEALVAIHMAHRLFALVATAVLGALCWRLWRATDPVARRFGAALALLLIAQLASGLSNVVLGWPLVAALGHAAGAAAMVLTLALLLARASARGAPAPALSAAAPA